MYFKCKFELNWLKEATSILKKMSSSQTLKDNSILNGESLTGGQDQIDRRKI